MEKLAIMTCDNCSTYLIKDLNNSLITFDSFFEAEKWIEKRSIKNFTIVLVTIYNN